MATFVKKSLDGKTRWMAVVRKAGRKAKKKTFDLKGQAVEWARRVEGDAGWAHALGTPGAGMTFEALAKQYQDAGLGRDQRVRFWIDQLGTRKLPDVIPGDIEAALDEYSRGKAEVYVGRGKSRPRVNGEKRGPASRNRMRSQLSSIFRWAMSKQLFNANPVATVAKVKEPKGRVRFLTDEEADRLLTSARNFVVTQRERRDESLRLRAERRAARGLPVNADRPVKPLWEKLPLLVMMALATGARASELTEKVRWERIDWSERKVQIDDTKNTESRVLILPVAVIKELMKHRQPTGLVFGRPEDPESPFTVKKHWLAAVKDAGIENFRFHDCRHTAASWMISAGEGLYQTGQVLGHKSPQSTARYAHLSVEAKKAAVDRVMTSKRLGGSPDSK
ncbi:MAG: hypothetical protein RJA59_1277 [Pseudomonadota bacterium]